MNFHEKIDSIKADVAALYGGAQQFSLPFTLCFHHSQ